MKRIEAHKRAKTGRFPIAARTDVFIQDDAGKWFLDLDGAMEPLFEAEVISSCKGASNWKAIRSEHFPMVGFHN